VTATADIGQQNANATTDLKNEVERLTFENKLLRAALAAREQAPSSLPMDEPGMFTRIQRRLVPNTSNDKPATSSFDWNLDQDTRYAHTEPEFAKVLHVFHRQWLGIRAAAGSLPGQKLAIDASRKLSREDISSIVTSIDARKLTRFVFHGMSENASALIRRLSGAGLASSLFIVYHGNVVQWCYEPERRLAFQALELARKQEVKRIHFMRKDHQLAGPRSFAPLLLNMSPVVSFSPKRSAKHLNVLLPGTEDWRKNLHCNALGAAMTPGVNKILHYAKAVALPPPYQDRLERTEFLDRHATLRLMSLCSATLYVSLAECHPMVALESEAVGTPCLRNRLYLDAFEDHPYVRLVEVVDQASPVEVSTALKRVFYIQPTELCDLIGDYLSKINSMSLSRYKEFLEL
jgi:hypothetical protein